MYRTIICVKMLCRFEHFFKYKLKVGIKKISQKKNDFINFINKIAYFIFFLIFIYKK